MRKIKVLGVIAVVALLGTSLSWAIDRSQVHTPGVPSADASGLYDRTLIWAGNPDKLAPTPIPEPQDPTGGMGAPKGMRQKGIKAPLVMPGGAMVKAASSFGGGAIVGPAGGAIYSPKQRADREISRLIRRLD